MLMLRYFLLLLLYQFLSFFQMWPWTYVWGFITWPAYLYLAMTIDEDSKKTCVATGATSLLSMEGAGLPEMPKFLRRRFELIHQEAVS